MDKNRQKLPLQGNVNLTNPEQNYQTNNPINVAFQDEAIRVNDLTSHAGGLVTRQLVKRGEEIAKEFTENNNTSNQN